jgi:hypothetical protein
MATVEVIGVRKRFGGHRPGSLSAVDLPVPAVGVQKALDRVRDTMGRDPVRGPFVLDVDLTVPTEGGTFSARIPDPDCPRPADLVRQRLDRFLVFDPRSGSRLRTIPE